MTELMAKINDFHMVDHAFTGPVLYSDFIISEIEKIVFDLIFFMLFGQHP